MYLDFEAGDPGDLYCALPTSLTCSRGLTCSIIVVRPQNANWQTIFFLANARR